MTILLLADIGSSHTEKWALGLASRGIKVGLFSFNHTHQKWYEGMENIDLLFQANEPNPGVTFSQKILYFRFLPKLKLILKRFKPDILHAHYASSYGLIGALSNYRPFIVSVWGSDIYSFPKEGLLKRKILQFVLKKSDVICSTSWAMAGEMSLYTSKKAHVIPFGVDTDRFRRKVVQRSTPIVFGTVKALENVYGIDRLLISFAKFLHLTKSDAVLLLYGSGREEDNLKILARNLGIAESVSFKGFVSGDDLITAYQNIDVFIALSRSESFGVAVLEASSMGIPVITSNVGGFMEVVSNDETGYIVDGENLEQIVGKMKLLAEDDELRLKMGQNGRAWVIDKYNFQSDLTSQIQLYQKAINEK
jgi:glycosyltransferase involved in cell wall biosynthesis